MRVRCCVIMMLLFVILTIAVGCATVPTPSPTPSPSPTPTPWPTPTPSFIFTKGGVSNEFAGILHDMVRSAQESGGSGAVKLATLRLSLYSECPVEELGKEECRAFLEIECAPTDDRLRPDDMLALAIPYVIHHQLASQGEDFGRDILDGVITMTTYARAHLEGEFDLRQEQIVGTRPDTFSYLLSQPEAELWAGLPSFYITFWPDFSASRLEPSAASAVIVMHLPLHAVDLPDNEAETVIGVMERAVERWKSIYPELSPDAEKRQEELGWILDQFLELSP